MNKLYTKESIENLIKENEIVLIYFGNITCGVCNVLKPKVEKVLSNYPKIKSIEVDVEKSLEISSQFNIFTIPAILVFIEGKETIREARYLSMEDLENKMMRYYELLYYV
jgi:thioredoxin-like negative regulator of GroEL